MTTPRRPRFDEAPTEAFSAVPDTDPVPLSPSAAEPVEPGQAEPAPAPQALPRTPAAVRAAYRDARPPKAVHLAFLALLGIVLVNVVWTVVRLGVVTVMLGGSGFTSGLADTVGRLVIWLLLGVVALYVGVQLRAGLAWARIATVVLCAVAGLRAGFDVVAAVGLLRYVSPYTGTYAVLALVAAGLTLALAVVTVALVFRPGARGWFHR